MTKPKILYRKADNKTNCKTNKRKKHDSARLSQVQPLKKKKMKTTELNNSLKNGDKNMQKDKKERKEKKEKKE